jgi:hypothetical protein
MPNQIKTAGTISQSNPLIKKNKKPAAPKRLIQRAALFGSFDRAFSGIINVKIPLLPEHFKLLCDNFG